MHCILRRCGVLPSTPPELCALHLELFTKPSLWRLFTRSSTFPF
ncbi:MAG: hypothetical protein NTY64_13125 [Deltaproteobacteria bacterium]|nr:hypothetical protein [Deltaproteobacteria bacterium]